MSPLLQKILTEVDQLTPEEQWQVISYLMAQLQRHDAMVAKSNEPLMDDGPDDEDDEWERQIEADLEAGRLEHVIAKVKAEIEANEKKARSL